jgi:uncharacterized protein YecT (DUF1311 family)
MGGAAALLLLFAVAASPPFASPPLGQGNGSIDRYWQNCRKHKENQVVCAERTSELANAEMSRVYREKISTLGSARANALRAGQKAWLDERETEAKNCATLLTRDHSDYAVQLAWCRADITVGRTEAIRSLK